MSKEHLDILHLELEQFGAGPFHCSMVDVSADGSYRADFAEAFDDCDIADIAGVPDFVAVGKVQGISVVPIAVCVAEYSYTFHNLQLRYIQFSQAKLRVWGYRVNVWQNVFILRLINGIEPLMSLGLAPRPVDKPLPRGFTTGRKGSPSEMTPPRVVTYKLSSINYFWLRILRGVVPSIRIVMPVVGAVSLRPCRS